MGAFYIIPKNLWLSDKASQINEVFLERGFSNPRTIICDSSKIVYYPKIGIDDHQFYHDTLGNIILVAGTLIYKRLNPEESRKHLLNDFFENRVQNEELVGTFCAIIINKNTNQISLIHDINGIYRFYYDRTENLISTSWLALAKAKETNRLNKPVLLFNLVMGHNPATETFSLDIERILYAEQLKNITYYRYTTPNIEHSIKRNSVVRNVAEEIKKSLKFIELNGNKPILGLSSGYDSRLVSAAIQNINIKDISFFTFFKPGDKDPEIARGIASFFGKSIKVIETSRPREHKEQEQVFNAAFNFFDGQVGTMMQYSKWEYTLPFRIKLMTESTLHLSGVGGELFRNYNNDHGHTIDIKSFITDFKLGGYDISVFSDNRIASVVYDLIYTYLKNELNITKNINYIERKHYYGNLFLRDWHGIRNSVENQYSYYYSPFTDPNIINLSYNTIPYQGYGGMFEAAIINSLSPELAKMNSEYGHTFDSYNIKMFLKDSLTAFAKLPVLKPLRRNLRRTHKRNLTNFEAELLVFFKHLNTGIHPDRLSSPSIVEPMLCIAYILKSINWKE